MQYTTHISYPIGEILLTSDGASLTGLYFIDGKYYKTALQQPHKEQKLSIFEQTKKWLDIYFSGQKPNFTPKLNFSGTNFQMSVWEILKTIQYGTTTTYGEIAKKIAEQRGIEKISAQAIGCAVGHNPISIIIPCHRVLGSSGSLTGYSGGIERKRKLLKIEGTKHIFISAFNKISLQPVTCKNLLYYDI